MPKVLHREPQLLLREHVRVVELRLVRVCKMRLLLLLERHVELLLRLLSLHEEALLGVRVYRAKLLLLWLMLWSCFKLLHELLCLTLSMHLRLRFYLCLLKFLLQKNRRITLFSNRLHLWLRIFMLHRNVKQAVGLSRFFHDSLGLALVGLRGRLNNFGFFFCSDPEVEVFIKAYFLSRHLFNLGEVESIQKLLQVLSLP